MADILSGKLDLGDDFDQYNESVMDKKNGKETANVSIFPLKNYTSWFSFSKKRKLVLTVCCPLLCNYIFSKVTRC